MPWTSAVPNKSATHITYSSTFLTLPISDLHNHAHFVQGNVLPFKNSERPTPISCYKKTTSFRQLTAKMILLQKLS